jgi:hypothetical protein
MNIQDNLENLQEILTKYLIDPIKNRTKWVYTDEGRIELDKSPYPKILIKAVDNQKEINALCSRDMLNTDQIEIHIKAKFGNHYGYGDEKYTGKEFVALIGSKINDIFKSEEIQNEIDDYGYIHIIPIGEGFDTDNEKNPSFIFKLQTKYIN